MLNDSVFDITTLFDGPQILKGIRQVNGTSPSFNEDSLEDGYLYLIRTSDNKEYGYVYLNGKRYGMNSNVIDCGTY